VVRSTFAALPQDEITVNIGEAAQSSGISAKMIRYYEAIGLLPPAGRTRGRYREYDKANVQRLRFVRRARDLGFSLERISNLLALWSDQDRHSADVKSLALAHISELEERQRELKGMIKTLRRFVRACNGDQRPNCSIIEELQAN
jgi:MerR family transcriptional regulator, copper efflux regulator